MKNNLVERVNWAVTTVNHFQYKALVLEKVRISKTSDCSC